MSQSINEEMTGIIVESIESERVKILKARIKELEIGLEIIKSLPSVAQDESGVIASNTLEGYKNESYMRYLGESLRDRAAAHKMPTVEDQYINAHKGDV